MVKRTYFTKCDREKCVTVEIRGKRYLFTKKEMKRALKRSGD